MLGHRPAYRCGVGVGIELELHVSVATGGRSGDGVSVGLMVIVESDCGARKHGPGRCEVFPQWLALPLRGEIGQSLLASSPGRPRRCRSDRGSWIGEGGCQLGPCGGEVSGVSRNRGRLAPAGNTGRLELDDRQPPGRNVDGGRRERSVHGQIDCPHRHPIDLRRAGPHPRRQATNAVAIYRLALRSENVLLTISDWLALTSNTTQLAMRSSTSSQPSRVGVKASMNRTESS